MFPVGIRDTLPPIRVPLRKTDPDVPLDLQFVLNQAYKRGPYRRGAIDYGKPPKPPFREADAEWARGLIEQAGVAMVL